MPNNSSGIISTVFNSTIELANLNGNNGFIINGIVAGDLNGYSVASVGDINSDGFNDVLIGARSAAPAGKRSAGQGYVIFGQRNYWASVLELSALNGTKGLVINGITVDDDTGWSVASAGDINGDGLQDLLIGAPFANAASRTDAGQTYIVFGQRSAWISPLELSSLNGTNGVIINGIVASDWSGRSVASVGDINGDGLQDIIIGSDQADPAGKLTAGQSYIIFGQRNSWTSPLELSSLNGANGVIINGIAVGDSSGISVASAGDINGDGLQDMIIGAYFADPSGRTSAGQSYVIFGKQSGWTSSFELSSLNGVNGFILNGIAANDFSGGSVASAGDVNGDGLSDIIIGASYGDPGGRTDAGQSYVVFGKRGTWSSFIELSSLTGANGFIINGIAGGDRSGWLVASAGDINNDGIQDIVIGGMQASPGGRNLAGQSYVVFGKRSNWASALELSSLNGTNGFIINGMKTNDKSGWSAASAGDVNSDGIKDIIIGAPYADPANKIDAGQSYVVFGDITIPLVNNQLTLSPGQSVVLNTNSLSVFTGNYMGEVYYSVSSVQNGRFELVSNPGVAVTQFTQTQLQARAVQFISTSINAPTYSIAASTGIGNAISSTSQLAQVSFIPIISNFNATIELANLNGKNGFTINGIAAGDQSGFSVASPGDISGDGLQDVIIGAYAASPGGRAGAGQSYVIFGKRSGWNSSLELSSLNGSNGFMINGIAAGDFSGRSVASAGDVNGDGLPDMIIGAYAASPGGISSAGQSYVIFGKQSSWGLSLELSSLNSTNGFMINGIAASDYSGGSLAFAGDINGDGLQDVIISAYVASPGGETGAGQSYVIFGKRSGWNSSLELSSLNGTNGFMINGIAIGDRSGDPVAPAGDINGDGLQDILIGAYRASPGGRTGAGQSYVIFGKRSGWNASLELSSLNGSNGFMINGIASNDQSGTSVASAGDINSDGLQDILIGARLADPSGRIDAGQGYIIFGKRSGWSSSLELSSLNGTNGFMINGIAANDQSSRSVALASDINGDGLQDVIIGAYAASPGGRSSAGQSYVIFGKRSGWSSSLELSNLNGTNGFMINGIAASDYSGYSVASAGDINNDGLRDIIIAATGADPSGKIEAGQSYVVFGDISILIVNDQLSISAGQSVVLNSNSLSVFTGNYTGEIYYSVSNVQNGYFQLLGNPSIAVTQFTQTQLNNNVVQFVSNSSAAPSYFVTASTGVGNAIPPAPQAAQVNFTVPAISTIFNATIELANLNGKNGFTINGIAAGDQSGTSVASAGDINGDKLQDIIIGAWQASPAGRTQAGQSYVIFGQRGGSISPLELSSLNGTNGFIINGIAVSDKSGVSVAPAGDINGDGLQDIIIGAYLADPSGRNAAGQSYVVFGQRNRWISPLELSSLNGTNGFIINGIIANDHSGISVASAGDFNGDGLQDVIIGAYFANPSGRSAAGQSYIVFGQRNRWISPLELSSLNGTNGFIINGIIANDQSGISVAPAGDFNGDGLQDVIIGAYQASPGGRAQAGQSYVIFGKRSGWSSPLALSTLNGTNGFIINGIAGGDSSGWSVASAGDVNSDGLQDVIIGALFANPAGKTQAGQSYVVFGKRESSVSSLELSSLNGTNGFIINGIAANDLSGSVVASASDVNGDGLQDIMIGAYQASPGGRTQAGQSYVIFGKRSGWSSSLALSTLNGTNGFVINGIAANDFSGAVVAPAGDSNGDGLQDIIINAISADPAGRADAGQSYMIFGDMTISLLNNRLTISAGQSVVLNSNSLSALTGNYTAEIYYSVSNVQNGQFELATNSGVAINQFTQTQLQVGLIKFISTNANAPIYSIVASTGIGSAIPPAPQAAQIYFSAPTTTVSTATYTNASTSVPTTVQVTSSSTPIPTTTIIVSTPQGNITITNTTQSTTVTSTSSSVVFTTSSSPVSIPTTTQPMISSTSSSSTSITIPTTSGVINITSTTSGQVTVTVPTTMTITSANTAATTTMPITQNTATPSSTAISSTALMSTLLASTAAASSTSVMTSTSTPKASSTTPAVVDTNKNSGSDISINIISAVAGAGGSAAILLALYLLHRYRKQRTAITQNTDIISKNKMYLPGQHPTLSETDVDSVDKVHHYEKIGSADSPYEQVSPAQGAWSSLYANNPAKEPAADAWASSGYATRQLAETSWNKGAYKI